MRGFKAEMTFNMPVAVKKRETVRATRKIFLKASRWLVMSCDLGKKRSESSTEKKLTAARKKLKKKIKRLNLS